MSTHVPGFQLFLVFSTCNLDESSLGIGRVKYFFPA